MKIGTCVNFSEIDGMEKKFAQLREHNFDSCQLVSWNPAAWTDENANTLKTLLEQYQITVAKVFDPHLSVFHRDKSKGELPVVKVPCRRSGPAAPECGNGDLVLFQKCF